MLSSNAGLYSHLFSALGFSLLFAFMLLSTRIRTLTRLLPLASLFTVIWGIAISAAYLTPVPLYLIQASEISKLAAWCFALLSLISAHYATGNLPPLLAAISGTQRRFALFIASLAAGILLPTLLKNQNDSLQEVTLVCWVLLSLTGLILVEQVYRNANQEQRWSAKHLCLGLGIIFAYDFFMYANALLFKHFDLDLWNARGVVNSLAVPLLLVSMSRMSVWKLNLQVSRTVVFHTATLTGAGAYLILMAVAGYFIRFYGGSWGGVLQITFFAGMLVLLMALLFSDKIRAYIRVLLSKHFFHYKYDYREEWQKFTLQLSTSDLEPPERICAAISSLVQSQGALLWGRENPGHYRLLSSWNMAEIDLTGEDQQALITFLVTSEWVIDLEEYRLTPGIYDNLTLPETLLKAQNAWLIVPLLYNEELYGFAIIKRSDLQKHINWEDRDLLKIAGKQAATHLAQHLANQALIQARQFEAFNRLSAYIVHDLKNILAQQSLIVANAEKHKHKPAFVDDVILTVNNSVKRMTRLMEQMRNGMRGTSPEKVNLVALLTEIMTKSQHRQPSPRLSSKTPHACWVFADPDQLGNVFGHLLQNAQEATPKDGTISIDILTSEQHIQVDITDTGCGMDDAFIKHRLFKPFDSTKGLTGMGIGVFESREVIRSLGGEISVQSQPGSGSTFSVTLPAFSSASGS